MSSCRCFEVDRPERKRHGHHDHADDRERPEYIDIGKQIDLMLQRLPDPGDGLRRRIGGIRPLRLEKACHGIDRLLIADIGWRNVFDQPALMKLLTLLQTVCAMATPIEPPRLRATLISADAWLVLS